MESIKKKLLEPIREFRKCGGYKINIKKLVLLLQNRKAFRNRKENNKNNYSSISKYEIMTNLTKMFNTYTLKTTKHC